MSRVYFTTHDAQAELRGSERAWLGLFSQAIGVGMLPTFDLRDVIYPESERQRLMLSRTDLETALRINISGLTFQIGTHRVEPWIVNLNTALLMGNDPVRLGTYIHAQCEVHGWFEPESFPWVVDVIAAGRESGLYRNDAGWEDVRDLFVDAEDPIVMSYSVTESFPDLGLVLRSGLGPEPHLDTEYWWEGLDDEARWDLSMKALLQVMQPINEKTMAEGFVSRDGEPAYNAMDLYDELHRLREAKDD